MTAGWTWMASEAIIWSEHFRQEKIQMNGRDRSSGWKHAKLSGHKNEVMVAQLLDTNFSYRKEFLKRVNASEKSIRRITIGGLHETNVPSVLGRSTKSKTDLKITFDDEDTLNFSIKKSAAGQVYFLSAENFIQVFEKQFEIPVPESVRRAMRLFWAATGRKSGISSCRCAIRA